MNPRPLVLLLVVALIFPPVGVPLTLGYLFLMVVERVGRDGGLNTRRQYDAWAKSEPWITGDPEVDEARFQARRQAAGR